jgi:hypothetical protein
VITPLSDPCRLAGFIEYHRPLLTFKMEQIHG